jgi:hypothetical protein
LRLLANPLVWFTLARWSYCLPTFSLPLTVWALLE